MRTRALFFLGATCALLACRQEGTELPPSADDGGELPPPVADTTPPPPDVETPVFAIGVWPGEGIPVITAVRDSLALRAAPSHGARVVATLGARRGEMIEYDSTAYQTLAAVQATALAATQLEGRDFGDARFLSRASYYDTAHPRRTIQVPQGGTVEYLQPRAEGTCFVRADGRVLEADACLVLDKSKFSMSGTPRTEWWVYAPNAGTPGWISVSDSTARVSNRTF